MNDAPKPPAGVKPRLPRGLADHGPADIAATERMLAAIRDVYALYGFEPVETPLLEYTDALGKFLPDLDRPNEGVFSLRDDDEQWLSLRYDLTAPLARYVAENFDRLPKPYRSYRCGPVFRNEKPGPGRYRQFMQFDADTVGSASAAADAEICMMAADTMERLGIGRGQYVIKINNRKVLDGVLEAIGLGGEANAGRRLTVLRAVDKLDRLGARGVNQLLGPGRKDESGDFTRGAGLSPEQIDRIEALWAPATVTGFEFASVDGAGSYAIGTAVGGHVPPDMEQAGPSSYIDNLRTLEAWEALFSDCPISLEGIDELKQIVALCQAAAFGSKRIRVDSSVVRGLEYYTGPVFEAELKAQVLNEQGQPVVFGSVGGGGRYDGLVGRFRGDNVPATGFSIGLSRLFAALHAIKSPVVAGVRPHGPVVVLVLDRGEMAHYQGLVGRLRQAGIAAELYLGAAGMNAQLKYADRRGSVCAVIQGSNERGHAEGPQVTVRDLVLGAELAGSSKDRADYLELRQKAQFQVAESALVDAVAGVLARHPA